MAFDPDKFMEAPAAEVGSTKFDPIPAGEYMAVIEDVAKPRMAGDRPVMDVTFKLMNVEPKILEQIGRTVLTVRKGYFLDLNADGLPDMGKGKNIELNRLKEALGVNKPGFKLSALRGAGPVRVTVKLRPSKDAPDVIYNDIGAVAKA